MTILRLFKNSKLLLLALVVYGCVDSRKPVNTAAQVVEDIGAKELVQGIWVDELTSDVVCKIEGDTVYFPGNGSRAMYFKIVGDSLIMGDSADKYLVSEASSSRFSFKGQSGELVELIKSNILGDSALFKNDVDPTLVMGKLVKKDTVVYIDNQRYRIYTTINPTTYKVYKSVYNEDGIKVDNIYYDNIINVAVFCGTNKLYSCDFYKSAFANTIPDAVLKKSVLGNMQFAGISSGGFLFRATVGVPDELGAYVVDTVVYRP